MRKTVDTRPLFLLERKRAPRAYKGLGGVRGYMCAAKLNLMEFIGTHVQKTTTKGKGRLCETTHRRRRGSLAQPDPLPNASLR